MKYVVSFFLCLNLSLIGHGKIYDCFLFFNELDVLDIRLHELDPYVDYFVLAESEETFRGNPKPLYFEENKERFTPFLHKIIHVVIRGHLNANEPFDREQMQRDRIQAGLAQADASDIIILSDVDEILRGRSVRRLALPIIKKKAQHVGAVMKEYQFYVNRYHRNFLGSMVTSFEYLKTIGFGKLRALRPETHQIKKAGWHFSSMGGLDRYIQKLEAYSLVDRDTPEARDPSLFRAMVESRPLVDIDESFPAYIRENLRYFQSIGFVN